MKKELLLLLILSTITTNPFAQTIFWTENFNNGCTSGCAASAYSGSNGAWTVNNTGSNGLAPNQWFVSCAENGMPAGSCGQACGNNATLHLGANQNSECTCALCADPAGDCGAAYDACALGDLFGFCNPLGDAQTDKRAESPLINCTGKSTVTLTFNYIENGQGTVDNATLWYYDGSAWSQLFDMSKTTLCGGQGRWTAFTVALPSSADNNPGIKLGFRWVNNSDGAGADPSFAVDDVQLSIPAGALPKALFASSDSLFCAESGNCIDFFDQSTGNPVSWKWFFSGAIPDTSTLQNPSGICYSSSGTYSVKFVVANGNGSDSVTISPMIIVGATPPPPVIYFSGDTLFSSYASAYQWYFNGSVIPGATDSFYVATIAGNYAVRITDSIGCTRISNGVLATAWELKRSGRMGVFPNPSQDEFTVYSLQFIVDGSMEIYSVFGEKVYVGVFNSKQKTVNCKSFASGVYLIKVNTGTEQWMQRIVIE